VDHLTTLYRQYGDTIFARCRAILQDDAEAEDATQETFLRIHRHLDRVPGEQEALFWIYRVATNYCLNELRSRKRRPSPTGFLPEPTVAVREMENRLADRRFARWLVEHSPTKVKPVAWLYHMDGFDQEEVARILALSRRTVASRLAQFTTLGRKYAAEASR
jgi:RNA polymerase sigma-70 factor (ECF subfamily)